MILLMKNELLTRSAASNRYNNKDLFKDLIYIKLLELFDQNAQFNIFLDNALSEN